MPGASACRPLWHIGVTMCGLCVAPAARQSRLQAQTSCNELSHMEQRLDQTAVPAALSSWWLGSSRLTDLQSSE